MSPAAQELFMSQIAPILIAAVPRVVIPVGAEDADELVQDQSSLPGALRLKAGSTWWGRPWAVVPEVTAS
jgi:hypothetical protein